MVRIIAGSAGGRTLKSFRGPGVRPTTERARESWFGRLGARVVGARFLDLYAGTGAVGIEALSRGAARCVLVEKSRRGAAVIRENLRVLAPCDAAPRGGGEIAAAVRQMDAVAALLALARAGEQFDLVFADPPYEDVEAPRRVLNALERAAGLLSADAEVTLQHSRRAPLPERVGRLERRLHRTYGDTALSTYGVMAAGSCGSSPRPESLGIVGSC